MEASNGTSKTAKLKLAAKRRFRKRPSSESFASSEEHPRGRSPGTGGQSNKTDSLISTTQSASSDVAEEDEEEFEDGEDGARDSDQGGTDASPARPAVPSTHPSQIGHLTTSSPIIQADHIPEVRSLDHQLDTLESLSQSAESADAGQTLEPAPSLSASSSGLQPPSDPSPRRSRSPAGRFKDAFRSKSIPNNQARPSTASSSHATTWDTGSRPGSAVNPPSGMVEPGFTLHERGRPKKSQPPPELPVRPHTPPPDAPKPVIVNTPPTPTETQHSSRASTPPTSANPNIVVSPSGNMISHRRARSGSSVSIGPSKLSNIISAPLTPTPENAVPPTPGGGFFSSVLSAAQNAATTLSTTITNTNVNSNANKKSVFPLDTSAGTDDRVEVESSVDGSKSPIMDDKEPAVKTLGMGDLSLSQLGFQETGSTAPTPTAHKFSDLSAESRGRSESAPVESEASAGAHGELPTDDLSVGRPKSFYEPSNISPPTSVYESAGAGIHRSASIRSAISKRRKRGSTGGTTGTGNTIAAAIAAANASVAHPTVAGSATKLTGFAVASKKRNRDFHALFKSVPDDDYLIEDYSCALQREILAHGRLYVSEGHICFSSNILGWVTTLVISFDEVMSVEKRSTALLFKNGLMISTLHAKHVFASFASRDSTYDLIVNIWKLGHPTLRSSLNGVSLDETGGDKTEKVDGVEGAGGSQSDSDAESDDSEDDEDIYDEDLEDDEIPDDTQPQGSPIDLEGEKAVSRKVSGAMALNGGAVDKSDAASPSAGGDFPGPATHGPTDCGDTDTHYEVIAGDEIIPAPLGKVYNLMFGPGSVAWMSKWLTNEEKCTDLQMEDKKGLTQDNKTRTFSYIKPLNSSIGPKQTKCIVTETMEQLDLEKGVTVVVGVQTPDVPSGNIFSVKTKYCLSWAENNSTHAVMTCTIEWSGKSWLKGPIEKGAKDGQMQYAKDVFAALKAAVSSRARPAAAGAAGKGKKKKGKSKLNGGSKADLPASSASSKAQDWGAFEPVHGLVKPVLDILKPIMTGNVVYGLLVGLLVAAWFGFGLSGQQRGFRYGRDMAFTGYADRAIAYEEIWNREESDLWDWLEERVGLHRMNEGVTPARARVMEPRTVEEKVRAGRMNEREVEEAIRVTEEKLDILKSVMDRKKEAPKKGSTKSNASA